MSDDDEAKRGPGVGRGPDPARGSELERGLETGRGLEAERGLIDRLDDLLLRVDSWRERRVVVACSAAVLLGLVSALWWFGRPVTSEPVDQRIPQVSLDTTRPTTTIVRPVVVHVAGAVARPGVYELVGDKRVLDAIEAAGGALADADLDQLNLASPLSDGIQLRVPLVGELLPTAPSAGAEAGPIDLNRSSSAELVALPGIGPATAAAIESWRQDNGPFLVVEDLLQVPGIGPAKLAALADLVIVR